MISTDEFFCTGTKEEVEQYQRLLDFGDDKIGSYYKVLCPEYQKCVYSVLQTLAGDMDFFGYNLKRFLKSYKEFKISQLLISRTLQDDIIEYLSEKEIDDFEFKGKGEKNIDNLLNAAKKTIELNEGTTTYKFVQTLCDYFFVDVELLLTGIGRISSIKEEWNERFYHDANFLAVVEEQPEEAWNARRRIKLFEDYLKEKGELNSNDTIIETEWAVMTYSGLYLMLKQKKSKKNEAKAIECLIMNLTACQIVDGKAPFEWEDEE